MIILCMGPLCDVSFLYGKERQIWRFQGHFERNAPTCSCKGEGAASWGRIPKIDQQVPGLFHRDRLCGINKVPRGGVRKRALGSNTKTCKNGVEVAENAPSWNNNLQRPSRVGLWRPKSFPIPLHSTTPRLKTKIFRFLMASAPFQRRIAKHPFSVTSPFWKRLITIFGCCTPHSNISYHRHPGTSRIEALVLEILNLIQEANAKFITSCF